MRKAGLVIISTPAVGHLISSTEFARRLLNQDDRFSVTILLIRTPFALDVDAYTRSLAATDPSPVQFILLPEVDPPPFQEALKSPENFISIFIESHKPHVRDAITNHVLSDESVSLVGLVVDLLCTSMIDVGDQLGVPSYLFFSSGASFLRLMFSLPARHDRVGTEFRESEPESIVPGYLNAVPSNVLPAFLFNKEGGYMSFCNHARRFREVKGIIVNTFSELEPHGVDSFLDDDRMPHVHTVGPLVDLNGQNRMRLSGAKRDEILNWLDDQPPQSVVFLCFGSMGSFGEPQLKEIAVALEQSGQPFLWSIRRPPPRGVAAMPVDYSKYGDILPRGFLDRTNDRGMMCGRVPQVEVLAHKAIGGFVSHCGWNSILESLWYGVPIVTWPLYAEQQINAFQMVKDLGLGVELKLDYRKDCSDVVLADEIGKAIEHVMDGESEVRKRVREMSQMGRAVVGEGGSSFAAFQLLIEVMLKNKSSTA